MATKLKLFTLTTVVVTILAQAQVCPRANTPDKAHIVSAAKDVLDGNWVDYMNSTLPSPNLYPHQWSWDAAFVAMGYSHYDTQRAIDETDALFRGQWQNGHIPHIVFNPSAVESYFPGPSFWKIETAGQRGPLNAQTSGITQPPVHAFASLAIYQNAPQQSKDLAMQHLRDIYPKLKAWHDYLYHERDPYNRDLVFIRHMWESGMDNSPAWDPTLARMVLKEGDVPPYQRVDKGKVGDHKERPDEFFYDRAVHLIKVAYDNEYDEAKIAKVSPFLIEDVLFNSILARAGDALAQIAEILGKHDEAKEHTARAARTSTAMNEKLYDENDGFFYNYDLVTKQPIKTRISGGLVGVFGARLSSKQLEATIKHLYSPGFLGEDLSSWTVPSVARDDPGYTNTTYWKGPAWININYLIREGLVTNANGNQDALKIAAFLKSRSIELLEKSGFYEYFNPISGSPHGGHQFSWSAALAIDWICGPSHLDDELVGKSLAWSTSRVLAIVVFTVLIIAAFIAKGSTNNRDSNINVSINHNENLMSSASDDAEEDEVVVAGRKSMEENILSRGNMRLRTRGPTSRRRD